MTTEQTNTLVLKDSAGSYYLVPQELLEQVRIPAEHTAELEGQIAAATQDSAGEADTQGYFGPLALVFAGVILGGVAGGISIHRAVSGSGGSGGGSAAWSYFENAYNQAKLQ